MEKGPISAKVKINVGGGAIITFTSETVEDLRLASGDSVTAIIKASDVLIGK